MSETESRSLAPPPRLILCDIYQTLLDVGPPPADAPDQWARLWRRFLNTDPPCGLDAFRARCQSEIARSHARDIGCGVLCPEVFWPAITRAAAPELAALEPLPLNDFLFEHAQLLRTVQLMAGAAETLECLRARGLLLGLASNCQPYTLRELDTALHSGGLNRDIFHPDLLFLSFRAGFSKPNPHAFQWLEARARGLGIAEHEILMVGDREDNDIAPAARRGWRCWRIVNDPAWARENEGDWHKLLASIMGPEERHGNRPGHHG